MDFFNKSSVHVKQMRIGLRLGLFGHQHFSNVPGMSEWAHNAWGQRLKGFAEFELLGDWMS